MVTIGKDEDVLVQFRFHKMRELPKWVRRPREEKDLIQKFQEGSLALDFESILDDRNAVYPRGLKSVLIANGLILCDVYAVPRPSLAESMWAAEQPDETCDGPFKITFVFRRSSDGIDPQFLAILEHEGLQLLSSCCENRWGCGKVRRFRPPERKSFIKVEFRDVGQKPAIEETRVDVPAAAWGFTVTQKGRREKK